MKCYERMTVWLFLLILFCGAILFWTSPKKSFSEQENRSLQLMPQLSAEGLLSGRFTSEMNLFFSDQFPFRDSLVGLKGFLEIATGKGENNGILLGRDGQLARGRFSALSGNGDVMKDSDLFDPAQVQNACNGICRAADGIELPFAVVLTGRNVDVAADAFDYPSDVSDGLLWQVQNLLSPSVTTVSTVPLLRGKFTDGEYVYYKTDHHWTTLGAYYGYVEIMKSFGMEADTIPIDCFQRRTVSTSFYGTLWSAGGMKWISPDSVDLWFVGNEDEFLVVADGKELDGFYSEAWLSKKDHYSVFLDGTHDVVTITRKDGVPRPRLLLLKDSFANSLAPFLAQHFDLILLNLSSTRQDFTDVSSLTSLYDPDRVLLVYTLENLITADKLCRLR